MPTKVTKVTKAPAKVAPPKVAAPTNPARTMKVLKAYTVAFDSPDLIKSITAAFDKHGRVAVTVQNDKALDRKMQQRIQSIAVRRGYDKNIKTAVDVERGYVTGCPANESAPKTAIKDPATPRAPKAAPAPKSSTSKTTTKTPAAKGSKTTASKTAPAKTTKGATTRKATVRRSDAQAAYDRSFAAKDAEAQAVADQEAQAAAIQKLKDEARAKKEAEAAADTDPLAVPADLAEKLAENLAADEERVAKVRAGVADVAASILNLDPPLDPESGLRVGVRGTDPVIETNYGVALGRPFKDRAVAVEVLAEIDALRREAASEA